MNENLYSLFASRFPSERDAPCLIVGDGPERPNGSLWSYAEVDRASARMANWMVSRGLKPGDRVAVQVDKSAEALVVYLATLRAGLVYLPLNPAYQRGEIEYLLGDATPSLFVHRPESRDIAETAANKAGVPQLFDLGDDGRGSLLDAVAGHDDRFVPVERRGGDLAAIVYTSGTTGRSKGAMLTHRNLAVNAIALHDEWRFRATDVLLHMLPIFHVHGLFVATHCALLSGASMLFEAKFDARRAIELLPKATVFMGVPTYYTRLLADESFGRERRREMRLFISGSAPLLRETFDEFTRRTEHVILERYGMTEGCIFTSNPYDGERRGGTVGFPLPCVEARIVDDSGNACPNEVTGHIQVMGETVFAGYWNQPQKTREEFTDDGWFKTGDLGGRDADGYVSIVGRSKDLIITGGLNVYPKEIEEAIDVLPGVLESAVIGLPHADFGEAVTAVLVRSKDEEGRQLSEANVVAALRDQLAPYKLPKRVFFVDELPRNTMGKVQKNVLRSQSLQDR